MTLLKQSTAATIKLGPFVDSTDGVTPETALTISQADIRLSKNGGAFAQSNNIAGATHDENGWYGVPLDTTDTATLGRLQVAVYESGALPCFVEFMVVPANVYDSLVSGTDVLTADVTQVSGDATSLADLKDLVDTGYDPVTHKVQGVVLTDTCTTNTDMRGTNSAALASVLGAAVGASISADIAAIEAQTDDIGAAGAGLTALGDARLANLDAAISTRATPAQVNTEVDTALADVNLDHLVGTATAIPAVPAGTYIDQIMDDGTAVYDRTTDSLQAIRDRGDAAWSTAGTPSVLIDTTIDVVTDQTHFTLTAGSDIDSAYLDQAIVMYDASNLNYPSIGKVSAYVGATKTVTLDSAPDFTIIAGDGVKVFVTAPGTTAPTVGQVADGVWDELIAGHVVASSTADTLSKNGKKTDRNFAWLLG